MKCNERKKAATGSYGWFYCDNMFVYLSFDVISGIFRGQVVKLLRASQPKKWNFSHILYAHALKCLWRCLPYDTLLRNFINETRYIKQLCVTMFKWTFFYQNIVTVLSLIIFLVTKGIFFNNHKKRRHFNSIVLCRVMSWRFYSIYFITYNLTGGNVLCEMDS